MMDMPADEGNSIKKDKEISGRGCSQVNKENNAKK